MQMTTKGAATMAIILDEQAREAVGRRRAQRDDGVLKVRLETIPARGMIHTLTATWAARRRPQSRLVERQVGDVTLHLDPRLARYTTWHDLTISAWRLGPLEGLFVVEEPRVLLDVQEWERLHPALRPTA